MESIKEILVKNQPAPFQTSKDKCAICGKPGATYRYPLYAERNLTQMLRCNDCREKEDAEKEKNRLLELEREKAEAEVKLKEAISDLEGQWRLDDSNMPGKFYEKTFENFDAKLQPKALEAVKYLQWRWDDAKDINIPPKSLVLLSPGVYGVGKTHLVCALVNHIITTEEKAMLDSNLYIRKRKCPVYFTSENQLLRRIRNTYNRSNKNDFTEDYVETEEGIYASLKRFSVLIIDDVGKVRPRDLNFLQGVYFNIIDQRYTDSQPIILTTNLDFPELETHIGGACADRLREMCGKGGFVKMTGKSYRHNPPTN